MRPYRRVSRPLLLLVMALTPVPALRAQEPKPPPAVPDSLYGLAGDSTAYPEEPVVILLNEGRHRFDNEGRSERSRRLVGQVLRQEAVNRMSEVQLAYDAAREEFRLDWARVVAPDGTVIAAEPLHVQELDAPVPQQAPIYTDLKRVRISLGGVVPGRIVDYQYTVVQNEPPMPGNVWAAWRFHGQGTVRRSRFIVDAPESLELRVVEENLPEPARLSTDAGRTVREWRAAELERVKPEPFVADSNGVIGRVTVSGPVTWDDIAAWYTTLAADRYSMSPELETKLAELTADAHTRQDSLRAVHRWVAQDIRYLSISLGLAGYQPRPPAEVLATTSGDCKDKTTLFVTLARHLGIEAYPVLVSTRGRLRSELPSVRQFNHMVAALRAGPDEPWHFLDLTVPLAPFDEVYAGLQGRRGLLVRDGGTAEIVDFPSSPAEANRSVIVIEGAIVEDGGFTGTYTEEVTGAIQYRIRGEFARTLNETQRDEVAANIAQRVFDNARADSLELFDGRDLDVTPRLRAHVVAENPLRNVGDRRMLPLRLAEYAGPEMIARLEAEQPRRFPIDAERVFGRREHLSEYRVTLPEGWHAETPTAVHATSVFGTYESTYEQDGRTLVVRRSMRGTAGVYPPDRLAELVEWLEQIAADDTEFIVLQPSSP